MRLKESLDKILSHPDGGLTDQFYSLLFDEHPELTEFFLDTEMREQRHKLTMVLQVVVYHHNYPNVAMSDYIKQLGKSHREFGISCGDYSKFRNVLLVAIEKFHGSESSPELSAEWTAALDGAIELMNSES